MIVDLQYQPVSTLTLHEKIVYKCKCRLITLILCWIEVIREPYDCFWCRNVVDVQRHGEIDMKQGAWKTDIRGEPNYCFHFLWHGQEYQLGTHISFYILLEMRFPPNELKRVKATVRCAHPRSDGHREGLMYGSTAIHQFVVKRRLDQNLDFDPTFLFSCLKTHDLI